LFHAECENTLISSTSVNLIQTPETIEVSRERWFVLAAFALFGMSIALSDVTSPILNLFLKLLDLDIKQYLYLQPLFYYVMMALAFPTAIFVDKYGIKRAMRVSAALFVLHGFTRSMLFFPNFPYHETYRIPCYIVSSIIGVEMMTMFFLLPLKVSETWFSTSERSVAWAFMSSQTHVGSCIASFLYPRIIKRVQDFEILAYINMVCTLLTALSSTLLVTKSEPEHPPNERVSKANQETPKSFRISLILMITHRDIVVHLVHLALFESVSLSFNIVMLDILVSIGYQEIFVGNLMSANLLITIVMQVVLAILVHGQKNPTLVCKLSSNIQGLLYVIHLLTVITQQSSWLLILTSITLTLCRCWVTPNLTNMTAHLACGTVSQATVVGFSMFLTVSIMTIINLTFTRLIVIVGDAHDYSHSLTFLCIITLLNELFYLTCFYGQQRSSSDVGVEEGRGEQADGDNLDIAVDPHPTV